MITNKLKAIEAAKAKIAALEKSIATELNKELASLPAKYGFDSVKAFAKAVKAAGTPGKVRSVAKPAADGKPGPVGKKRTRAVITDATRAEVKKLVEAGKSGSAIAKSLKISLPSVQNIKKALGLVKARKK
jgi:DNA-binding NarL/FixJ family response regulator